MKCLEDEADITLVKLAALFVGTFVNGLAEKVVLPAPRAIKHPEDAEKRRFARAGRPHDGYELPFHHFKVDAAQGKVLFCACRKVLFNISCLDHRREPPRKSRQPGASV